MRALLVALLLTIATQAEAEGFFVDPDISADDLSKISVMVVIDDNAKGACWTNLREVREYAEEKFRFKGVMDMSRFDAAPLIAFIAAKETDYGNETDGRIPG